MIKRVDLIQSKKDLLLIFLFFTLISILSLFIEYKNFQEFTQFDNHEMDLYVLNQYSKTKEGKTYEVLKLQDDQGVGFYSISKLNIKNLNGYKIRASIWTAKLNFEDYLRGFYARTQLLGLYDEKLARYKLAEQLDSCHPDKMVSELYGALFFATPISKSLRDKLSILGISHLLAISGFHLGVLSFILFFLLKRPYLLLQNKIGVTRHRSFDLMILVATLLYAYIALLGFTPSLLRSFVMMILGFILYDRGIKVISMQTLFLATLILLALFPRLFFSIAFYLSLSGVFYIFLFIKSFDRLSKLETFIGLHVWVYLMMLPISLYIFQTYSLLHPLSILFTMAFIIFYPLVLFLHLTALPSALDSALEKLFSLELKGSLLVLDGYLFFGFMVISLLSVYFNKALYLLLAYALSIFIYAIYQVT